MKLKDRFSLAAFARHSSRSAAFIASIIDLRDVFFFGGLAAACYGASLVYPPAPWIIGGSVVAWKAR